MGKRKEIFQLLAVLFSAIGIAVVVAAVMLFYYGPTGRYSAQNVLLEPTVLPKLSYQDKGTRYAFDHVEVAFYEPTSRNWTRAQLDDDQYRQIFSLLSGDRSMRDVSDEIKTTFNREKIIRLSVIVKPGKTPFQTIDFAKNRYRVELVENGGGYAYFTHKNIQEEIISIVMHEG